MSRLKFPLTRRDKFYIFGNEDQALEDIDDQEFYIRGAIYKPGISVNADGTVPLQAMKAEPRKPAIPPAIFRRFFDSQQPPPPPPLASNEESWSNVIPVGGSPAAYSPAQNTPARGSPCPDGKEPDIDVEKQRLATSPGNGNADKVSLSSANPAMPLGSEAANQHNTTLGTIREERIDPGDFVIKYYASVSDMIWFVWAILMYIADVFTDIFLALMYYRQEEYLYFALTLGFVAVPSLVMTIFSLTLYIRDWKIVGDKASPVRWFSRAVFLLLQLGPLLRIVDAFIFACRSRQEKETNRQKTLYERMMDEDVDGMLMRMFEAFMEAAPQLVLQLYIMTQLKLGAGPVVVSAQCAGIAFSLISLAVCMVSFQKSMRTSQPEKALMTRPAMIIMFCWRVLTIGARVTAFAMFASKFTYFVFIVVAVHWLVMLFWVSRQDTKYCTVVNEQGEEVHSSFNEFWFRVMSSFVHIFCFFNIIEGHTRLRCIVYYGIVFSENFAMILMFYIQASVTGTPVWYDLPAVLFVTLGFAGGIFFQIVYYKSCHPNNFSYMHEDRTIKWWVPIKDLSLCYDPTWNLDDLDFEGEKEAMNVPAYRPGPPPTKFLRPILRKTSSGSESSNRSNFIQKTELDEETKARLNLKYHKPEKLDDIVNQSNTSQNVSTV